MSKYLIEYVETWTNKKYWKLNLINFIKGYEENKKYCKNSNRCSEGRSI